MEFEDILKEVGGYGKFQKLVLAVFIIPLAVQFSWFSLGLIFMTSTPEHWCQVPELVVSNLSLAQRKLLVSPPQNPSCSMYNVSYEELLQSHDFVIPNKTELVSCAAGWEYDKSNWETTLATKWDLVCKDSHYTSLILSMQSAGGLVGTTLYGALSDRFGRKRVFLALAIVCTSTEICSMLFDGFMLFVALRFINGTVFPTMFTLSYILIVELVAPDRRAFVNGVMNCCYSVGICFVPLVAYLSSTWIVFPCANSVVILIVLVTWKILPESPAWLISRGRYEDARDVLMTIANKNNMKQNSTTLLTKIKTLGERNKKKKEDSNQSAHTIMFKYPRLKRHFFIMTFCWAANAATYLGLTYNTRNLMGNEYMNFFLVALVEGPGCLTFWIAMDRLGRRWTSTSGFLLTSVVCLLPAIGFPHVDKVSTVLGKYIISGNFIVTDQQGSELYPTVIRTFATGLSFTIAKMGTFMIPYLAYLSVYGRLIPFLVLSGTCFVAAVLASFLPETVNENLPQTITDSEELGRHQKYFSWIRKKNVAVENSALHQAS